MKSLGAGDSQISLQPAGTTPFFNALLTLSSAGVAVCEKSSDQTALADGAVRAPASDSVWAAGTVASAAGVSGVGAAAVIAFSGAGGVSSVGCCSAGVCSASAGACSPSAGSVGVCAEGSAGGTSQTAFALIREARP